MLTAPLLQCIGMVQYIVVTKTEPERRGPTHYIYCTNQPYTARTIYTSFFGGREVFTVLIVPADNGVADEGRANGRN